MGERAKEADITPRFLAIKKGQIILDLPWLQPEAVVDIVIQDTDMLSTSLTSFERMVAVRANVVATGKNRSPVMVFLNIFDGFSAISKNEIEDSLLISAQFHLRQIS
jgi:hypothetical protein